MQNKNKNSSDSLASEGIEGSQIGNFLQDRVELKTLHIEALGIVNARVNNAKKYAKVISLLFTLLIVVEVSQMNGRIDAKQIIHSLVLYIAFQVVVLTLYLVNYQNKAQLRAYYRHFNKVVYIYLASMLMILSIFTAIFSVLRILNPLHGYKQTDPSRIGLAGQAVVSTSLFFSWRQARRGAKRVDDYYKFKDT